MADDTENPTLELLRRLRVEQGARFDRIDTTLAEVLTQMRIHGTHIAGWRSASPVLKKRLELRDE